jgi:hypothetical protein
VKHPKRSFLSQIETKVSRLAAVPQLLAIAGNTYGYQTNRFQ